jgi:hypothetical protein
MTDPRPPLTDEDLSAVVDGEAEPHLVERVRSDPSARVRADQLHAAGQALRATPVTPLDAATVDAMIGRALDASVDTGGPDPVVTPLTPPVPGRRGPAPWLVAAAIVALVAIGLGLVWSGTRSDEGEFATVGDQVADEAGDPAGDGDTMASAEDATGSRSDAEAGQADGAAPEALPAPPHGAVPTTGGAAGNESASLPDLGAHDTAADLRTALRDGFPDGLPLTSGTPVDSPTRGAVDRCRNQAMVTFDLEGPADAEGVAEVDGRLVLVYEFEDAAVVDGNTYVIARGIEACDPVLDFQR